MNRYLERLVDPWIAEVLASVPAVMITGARAVGKTTTALSLNPPMGRAQRT